MEIPLIEIKKADIDIDGRKILSDITWALHPGENWFIDGPNGAGKTTLLRLISGKIWPSPARGGIRRYRFFDPPSESPVGLDGHLAYVSPEMQQHYQRSQWDVTGEEIVMSVFSGSELLYEPISRESRDRVARVLKTFRLTGLARRPYGELSQGELRRILIARAFASEPQVMVLDEIYDGLDAQARRETGLVIDRAAAGACQIVMTAHRPEDRPSCITHIARMGGGRINAQERVSKLSPGKKCDSPKASTGAGSNDRPESARSRQAGTKGYLFRAVGADVYRDLHGPPVLRQITWTVEHGQYWSIMGPNGSGKSTLLKLIYGDLVCAAGGRVDRFSRFPEMSVRGARGRMGYLSAELQASFDGSVLVMQTIASGFDARVGGSVRIPDARRSAAMRILRRLGLESACNRSLGDLSYGEARRILIGRSLVHRPSLLLMDEPFDGLDEVGRATVVSLLERWVSPRRSLILVSNHDSDFPHFMNRHLTLKEGRIATVE